MRKEQLIAYYSELARVAAGTSFATATEFLVRTFEHRARVLQSGNLQAVDRDMRRPQYKWKVQGATLTLPSRSFGGAREMYARQVYFAVPGFELRERDIVLDLGANQGLFTLLAAVKCAKVISVEAQSGFARDIDFLLKAHAVADKVAIEYGLIGGEIGVFADLGPEAEVFGDKPKTLSMTELIERHGVDRIDFLKCDIEGSEFDLIRTGKESWLSIVRRIAMEVHTPYGDHQLLAEQLVAAGFRVWSLDQHLKPLTFPVRGPASYLYAMRF